MPIITSLGRGQHTFKNGSGLYTASDAVKGDTPTPSQLRRGTDQSEVDRAWWLLSHAQKRVWQDAANQLLWADLGASPATPTGRKLYSRLNRSRHLYCLSTGGTGSTSGLASVAAPPGEPVQLADLGGCTLKAQAPGNGLRGWESYEYVQQAYFPGGGEGVSVNPAQRSFAHPCRPQNDAIFTRYPGEDTPNVQNLNYWQSRGYFFGYEPNNDGLLYRGFLSNAIPHYDSFFGGLEVGFSPTPANVFVELLFDRANQTTDGPGRRWQNLAAIPAGVQAQGGAAMPQLYADQPGLYAFDSDWPLTTPAPEAGFPHQQSPPNDGLNDLRNMLPWPPPIGVDGAAIRVRMWPFDNAGWPGSKVEVRSTILPPPPYQPLPGCG